jgi:hypothetical protein
MLMLMLGGHTGLNSTHAKSCRLNLYGADRQHFPVAYYSTRRLLSTVAHSNSRYYPPPGTLLLPSYGRRYQVLKASLALNVGREIGFLGVKTDAGVISQWFETCLFLFYAWPSTVLRKHNRELLTRTP